MILFYGTPDEGNGHYATENQSDTDKDSSEIFLLKILSIAKN